MATDTSNNGKSPADEPGGSSEELIPGPDSGLRNPPSAVERGLKEAADTMHEPKRPEAGIAGIAGEKRR